MGPAGTAAPQPRTGHPPRRAPRLGQDHHQAAGAPARGHVTVVEQLEVVQRDGTKLLDAAAPHQDPDDCDDDGPWCACPVLVTATLTPTYGPIGESLRGHGIDHAHLITDPSGRPDVVWPATIGHSTAHRTDVKVAHRVTGHTDTAPHPATRFTTHIRPDGSIHAALTAVPSVDVHGTGRLLTLDPDRPACGGHQPLDGICDSCVDLVTATPNASIDDTTAKDPTIVMIVMAAAARPADTRH